MAGTSTTLDEDAHYVLTILNKTAVSPGNPRRHPSLTLDPIPRGRISLLPIRDEA